MLLRVVPAASQTSSVSSFSCSAPVGQAAMHWPQLMQAMSASGMFQRCSSMAVLKPRYARADHADALHSAAGGYAAAAQNALVVVAHDGRGQCRPRHSSVMAPAKRSPSSTPRSRHSFCSSQFCVAHAGQALLVVIGKQQLQVHLAGFAHLRGCWSSRPSPSLTGQHARRYAGDRAPVTSTTHIRHAPISFTSFK